MPIYLDTRGNSVLSVAVCDRCNRKFAYTELQPDPNFPGMRVCKDDLDQYDPWRLPARQTENIALRHPRPDVSLARTNSQLLTQGTMNNYTPGNSIFIEGIPPYAAAQGDLSLNGGGFNTSGNLPVPVPPNAPTVTGFSPSSGSEDGGTVVTITGTGFSGTYVLFGNTYAEFTVINDTTIEAIAPKGIYGQSVRVTVITEGGRGVSAQQYTYTAGAPKVYSITPNTGDIAGGESVLIGGYRFSGATSVTIGGTEVPSYTIIDDSRISATTPAHNAGAVNVTVTTPIGTGTGVNLFTYAVEAPTVLSISPNTGDVAGGEGVTITGTNFINVSSVKIGGTEVPSYTVVDQQNITATTPAHAAGSVNVTVTAAGGTATGTNLFTYSVAPIVDGSAQFAAASSKYVTSSSLVLGTQDFSIETFVYPTGTAIASSDSIMLGGDPSTAGYPFLSSYVQYTPGDHGVLLRWMGNHFDFVVGTQQGGAGGMAQGFHVSSPSGLATNQWYHIVVCRTGNTFGCFVNGSNIYTGTASLDLFENEFYLGVDNQQYQDFFSGNQSNVRISIGSSIYNPSAPTITVPTSALNATANTELLTLKNYENIFKDYSSNNFVLTTYNNTPTSSLLNPFDVIAAPTVLTVTPNNGSAEGGTNITIGGTNFAGATSVTIGGTSATFNVINSSTINATTPAHAAGAVNVSVTTPGGTGTGTNLFTYTAAPEAIYLTPGTTSWTVPIDWSSENMIELWGGGGGGGNSGSSSVTGGSGGGGGGYSRITNTTSLTPGQTITVAVGAGGAAAPNGITRGGNGGTTTFGAASATGGTGGTDQNGLGSVSGGTGSGGNVNYFGGSGGGQTYSVDVAPGGDGEGDSIGGAAGGGMGFSNPNPTITGGDGAAGFGGAGGARGISDNSPNGFPGADNAKGGGGGGSAYYSTGRGGNGGYPGGGGAGTFGGPSGNGADGVIKITYTKNPNAPYAPFTSNGTYTVPSGVNKVVVLTVGHGHPGSSDVFSSNEGGGYGGQVIEQVQDVTPGQILTVDLGAQAVPATVTNGVWTQTSVNGGAAAGGGSDHGGGGAGNNGANPGSSGGFGINGGDGGIGVLSQITGEYYGAGGGGAAGGSGIPGDGGLGGGGTGCTDGVQATPGAPNTGGGGGGGRTSPSYPSANGGTGFVAIMPLHAPTITGLTPDDGGISGGDTITITGTNFTKATQVTIAGVPVSFTVLSRTTITAITPAHAVGSVTVTVTNPVGTATATNAFTYYDIAIPFTALLVGGGGGGGVGNGAGGEGGQGGQVVELPSFNLTRKLTSVFVGQGGPGATQVSSSGYSGGDSYIEFTGFSEAAFGGTGGNGSSGGCGGSGGAGNKGSNPGGTGSCYAPWNGGDGGDGVTSNFTGSAVTYAGGGGGGTVSSGGAAVGGIGGGGNGAYYSQMPATNGTNGLGGGGGGGSAQAPIVPGGTGGKGVVIIKYLTADTAGYTITGGTITTDGAYTIHTFTSSGTLEIQTTSNTLKGTEPNNGVPSPNYEAAGSYLVGLPLNSVALVGDTLVNNSTGHSGIVKSVAYNTTYPLANGGYASASDTMHVDNPSAIAQSGSDTYNIYSSLYEVPKVVAQNCLVMYDFSNPACYPGTGSIVYDLTEDKLNGQLVGSPTFVSNGGQSYIQLDNTGTQKLICATIPSPGFSTSWVMYAVIDYSRAVDLSEIFQSSNWGLFNRISGGSSTKWVTAYPTNPDGSPNLGPYSGGGSQGDAGPSGKVLVGMGYDSNTGNFTTVVNSANGAYIVVPTTMAKQADFIAALGKIYFYAGYQPDITGAPSYSEVKAALQTRFEL